MDNIGREKFWNVLLNLHDNTPASVDTLMKAYPWPKTLCRFRSVSKNSLQQLNDNKLFFSSADYYDDPFDTYFYINIDEMVPIYDEMRVMLSEGNGYFDYRLDRRDRGKVQGICRCNNSCAKGRNFRDSGTSLTHGGYEGSPPPRGHSYRRRGRFHPSAPGAACRPVCRAVRPDEHGLFRIRRQRQHPGRRMRQPLRVENKGLAGPLHERLHHAAMHGVHHAGAGHGGSPQDTVICLRSNRDGL